MKTLIIVDIQNDFFPGGSLGVDGAPEVIPIINALLPKFDHLIATQDWHPKDHASFAENHEGKEPGDRIEIHGVEQILWPAHCVQNTKGSEFVAELEIDKFEKIFHKGTDRELDSYSSFFDNERKRSTGLGEYLKEKGLQDIYICGVATDYCVKYSVLDALDLGFTVTVIQDACKAVNLKPLDGENAIEEMIAKGAQNHYFQRYFLKSFSLLNSPFLL